MPIEAAQSRPVFANINPATGELLGEYPSATPGEVRHAVERAHFAQPSWSALPLHRRVEALRRFQQLLVERKQQVAETISAEAGKPAVEALTSEILVVLDAVKFCAANAARVLREENVPHANPALKTKRGRLLWEPVGVVGIISPWNYPFSIPATDSLAALVLGNAVVLKPSELTPNSTLLLRDLLYDAGVPRDVFQVVLGEGPTGAALLESGIDKLIFTGSVATGRRVAVAAAQRLIPVVLELGGKDPMIVLEDANVDVASSGAVWGSLMNCGQTCISVERCYVHRSLFDRFVSECARKMQTLRVAVRDGDIGPLISQRQLEIVAGQVADAVASGATVVCGGCRLPELGPNFYAPTLLTGVTPQMRIMREETFGPVLPVIPFSTDDEAVALANDSEFGLAASVWSRSRHHGESIARRIRAGCVMVNDAVTGFGISEAPHGGFKSSGIGRTHGVLGMREMLQPRYVDVDMLPHWKQLWWYGYGGAFASQMGGFVDFLFSRKLSTRLAGGLRSAGSLFRRRL